jgi:hypothetical protein
VSMTAVKDFVEDSDARHGKSTWWVGNLKGMPCPALPVRHVDDHGRTRSVRWTTAWGIDLLAFAFWRKSEYVVVNAIRSRVSLDLIPLEGFSR